MQSGIENEWVLLRPITYEDTDHIIKWRNSEEVRSHFISQELFTKESHTHWMKEYVEQGLAVQMIIYDKTDQGPDFPEGRPVGSVYLRDISKIHHKAEYGIFIGETSARGKGIGTQAAQLMLLYAFTKLKLHKVFLRVFADNERAVRSYEKAGFVKEAYLRDDVFIQGEFKDMILMAAIRN